MRFRYTVRVYTRTHARARVLIALGHDVSCTYTIQYLVAGVGDSPTGDARAFCATYFGGERLAPCRAGVVCTVTETTHTTSRKENGGEEKGGGGQLPPLPPPPLDPPLGTFNLWYNLLMEILESQATESQTCFTKPKFHLSFPGI